MLKKTTLIVLITLFPIIQAFSQDVASEAESKSKHISIEGGGEVGLAFVQDRISPGIYVKLGVNVNDNFKINLVAQGNYFFSTRNDNSRERTVEPYYGLEIQMPDFLSLGQSTKDRWSGIGVSYCPKPLSELHKKNPIKVYSIVEFGTISISTEYVWSDFFYPGINVRFGF